MSFEIVLGIIKLMKKYLPNQIEPKWQKKWKEDQLYFTDLSDVQKKYYVLVELPYTSGDLHMGHWFTFTIGDILARFKHMSGFNVLYPNGFDAFGLPAENAAIKNGIHPRDWTLGNMERMKGQFETLGTSIDWTKTMVACDPKYYKWNQWIFLKMLEKGLAYRGKLLSNWCPVDQTVLANENVENGRCWRCGSIVVQKEVDQWLFKITDYADKLIWQEPPQADWPKPLRVGQNDWIGRSEGALIRFDGLEVFTTRQDTIFGATFVVISPEHPLLAKFISPKQKKAVEEYAKKAQKKSELERKENKEKSGVFTGSYVKNPFTGKDIPVWVADYVLTGYGTGVVMGVPAHDKRDFEFAKKFDLSIKRVIEGGDLPYEGEGVLVDSGKYSGMPSEKAREKITKDIETDHLGKGAVQYHLHDWSISRQRYWGTPIPIIYCEKCGTVPVPEEDLPVELPYKVEYAPKGKPPLATAEDWVNVACPKCKGPAKREVETMDTFVDSAWYFFRYLDPENDKEIFGKKVVSDWMPLEIYVGGPEHTLGHALYSRFFTKFFKDLGLISFDEYAKKRIHHGTILGPDGARMSKSRGNVVNPDEEVKKYGADSIRVYLMFLGPVDIVTPWSPEGINGVYHFLQRVWGLQEKVTDNKAQATDKDLFQMHRTIKRVAKELEGVKFNTAIAALMEWLNYLSRKSQESRVTKEEYKTFLKLLAPFAPHITEELWAQVGGKYSIHQQSFPEFDSKYLQTQQVQVVVQVNGKLRDTLLIDKDIVRNREDVEKLATEADNAKRFLEGKTVKRIVHVEGKLINFVI